MLLILNFSLPKIDNFRSAENSPKEHNSNNSNNLTRNNNSNTNTVLDGTYTLYTAIDNGGGTPSAQATTKANQQQQQQQQQINVVTTATANGRRFVNVEKFVMQR